MRRQGVKVSVNDCVIRAAALALRDVPAANASWDAAAGAPARHARVDISIAVATEGGLITPIVRDAANKSLQQVRPRALPRGAAPCRPRAAWRLLVTRARAPRVRFAF